MVDLGNVTPLTLPWVSDPWGCLRPPLSVEAVRLSAQLAEATYSMAVNPWLCAGWRDVTIQVDGSLTGGLERVEAQGSAVQKLANAWKLHRIRRRIRQRNPIGQVVGALRQWEKSDTGKVLVMLHPAEAGRHVVAISFMGTGGRFYDWFSNFRMTSEQGVHKGFLQLTRQFEENEEDIDFPETARELGLERLTLRHILEEAKNPNSRFTLWLCGHSQGGALMQIYAHHKITEDGILPANMVGYGLASPSVMTGDAVDDPAAYPLYHIFNSDDVVPRMGAQIHLGVCLIYPADEDLRSRCYAWPLDVESARRRAKVWPILCRMTDTASCIEVGVAYLNALASYSPEEIVAGLSLLETRLPIGRVIAAADSRMDAFLRYIVRHMAAAYVSITGERMDTTRVANHQAEISQVVKALGVRVFSDTLMQMMAQPHSIAYSKAGGAYMGAYPYIALYGVEKLIPAVWRSGRPPQLIRASFDLARPMPRQKESGLHNRRRITPPRRIHRHPRYTDPRQRIDTRHHTPTLTPGTMQPGERIVHVHR